METLLEHFLGSVDENFEVIYYPEIPTVLKAVQDIIQANNRGKIPAVLFGSGGFTVYENAKRAKNVVYSDIDYNQINPKKTKIFSLSQLEILLSEQQRDKEVGLPSLTYVNLDNEIILEHYLFLPVISHYSEEIPEKQEEILVRKRLIEMYGITKNRSKLKIIESSLSLLRSSLESKLGRLRKKQSHGFTSSNRIIEYEKAISALESGSFKIGYFIPEIKLHLRES